MIVGCKASPFEFNHFFFLDCCGLQLAFFLKALTILLCLIPGVGLRISFHEFISGSGGLLQHG
jgi:hypothetical protein